MNTNENEKITIWERGNPDVIANCYLEKSLMSGWEFLTGDINYMTYGGKWVKQVNEFTYHVIELINMIEATGEENQDTYNVELQEIDLDTADIEAALTCNGIDTDADDLSDLIIVECVSSYGQFSPMGDWSGNNYRKLLQIAKRESSQLSDNDEYHYSQLARPVNRIGSSALEYSRGDIHSAIIRGIANDRSDAKIMGKIHGYSPDMIEEIRTNPDEYKNFSLEG